MGKQYLFLTKILTIGFFFFTFGLITYFLFFVYSSIHPFMGGNDSSRTVEVTMGPPEGEVWVCNESRREIEEIKLSLLEKIVVFKDIPGDGAVRKTNINTDISGRFNLYIRIVFKGGEVKEYRTSFVRPKHVSGLYVGIDEKVDITFGR